LAIWFLVELYLSTFGRLAGTGRDSLKC